MHNRLKDPLGWLLGDAAERFLDTCFEMEPVVIHHGDADRFRPLLSIAAVDRKIAELDLREGILSMANAKEPIQSSDFVAANGVIDRVAVARLYRRGGTVILNQLHQSDITLAAFCRAVERIFSCHVQTNIYLTPAGSQGFHTHYDSHDVFILQIEGEKAWRLYDRPVDAPYRGESFEPGKHPVGEPRQSFTLKAGDCAYVPRGLMHDASTSGECASLHITCGLLVKTWADLMLEAVSQVCVEDPRFRRSLPPGFANTGFDRGQAQQRFSELATSVAGLVEMGPSLDVITDLFIRSREPDVRGAIEGASKPLAPRYRARPTLWKLEDADPGLRLVVPGGDMTFARAPRATLERALDGEPFGPHDLEWEEAEDVIRRLATTGLIEAID